MSADFFEKPILNSPYNYPGQHWELDTDGQPTNRLISTRRPADFITPVPKPKKRKKGPDAAEQMGLLTFTSGFSTEDESGERQEYNATDFIMGVRTQVDRWRKLPESAWKVTPETARLLKHWRSHPFHSIRPFFCQIEAVETAIWLTEVAPRKGKFWDHIESANEQSNPELLRVALKLATGAGKTMVMSMLIAWQTINAVRHPQSNRFTRGFLIVAPGITIKDRLRVLFPNDPDSYYQQREIVPNDMLPDLGRAKIVVTNYHSFKLRERIKLAKGTRQMLQGHGPELKTLETEGQMLQRVMPDLMGMKNILVINDEAHHCYRERPNNSDIEDLKGDDKKAAKKENEAARLWINGIETIKRQLGVRTVFDLSATPFFLSGSGYREGTLFPWVVSDFSLMDAIECGIVKLPRVPVADNVPGGDMPKFRNLWEHVGKQMPKKGRGKGNELDPLSLPLQLQTALEALYNHYEKTYAEWKKAQINVPPVFIVVCNNTSTSKLVYDYISGFHRENDQEKEVFHEGRLPLFRNFDEHGNRLGVPKTLLIDSQQLESGEALDDNFKQMSADAIERFRREINQRGGNQLDTASIPDQDLLREVMNTVGKEGRLGADIHCVVSVSMLTEGWDANTVTHVLGLRAFGTQLLCEQVIGRALRRQSYELNEEGLFNVEYADVFGIPFDFTAKPVVIKPQTKRRTEQIQAIRPERDTLEISFPRVEGYRVELPSEKLTATFAEPDSVLELTPHLVGPSITENQGIIGEGAEMTIERAADMRKSELIYNLTRHLLMNKFRDPGEEPKLHLFGQLKRIVRQWLDGGYLHCTGGTHRGQLMYQEIANMACERIFHGINTDLIKSNAVKATLDPYNPTGSSGFINFNTSKTTLYKTDLRKCQINWVVCDGDWEAEFARVAESHPRVRAYVKNQGMGFDVPYLMGGEPHRYVPDFIVQIDDGQGADNRLNLVVEIKGFRGEDAKEKASTMRTLWVPGVNRLKTHGRWAFAEFKEVFEIERQFKEIIDQAVNSPRRG